MTGPPRELTRSERAAIRRLVTGLCANYDEREKLCLPLDCPCYMLHKWWTGGLCRYFERSVLPVEPGKPDCPLIGQDGNIFNLVGIASRTLKAHGMPEQAKEMADRVFSCDSYHKALCIIGEYVNITSTDREAGRPHSIRQQLKNNKAPETAAPKKAAKEPER